MAQGTQSGGTVERRRWMSTLARAPSDQLRQLWEAFPGKPGFDRLRAPEIGSVMVRGRMGASGGPFNLGEMSVTRCSVVLADGTVGHGYVQGRARAAAEIAAVVDALMQTAAAGAVRAAILSPLQERAEQRRQTRAAKAAATRVEFFTLARGED